MRLKIINSSFQGRADELGKVDDQQWHPLLFTKRQIHMNITITSQWARWRLKSPASQLFTQPFIQVHIKENIKTQRASNTEIVSIWWRHHGLPDINLKWLQNYTFKITALCDGTICDSLQFVTPARFVTTHRLLQFVTRHDLWPKVLQFVTSVIQWF